MTPRWPILAVAAACAGYLTRCELDRRRARPSPQLEASLRHTLRGDPKVTRMAAVIGASLEPGDRVEALTAAVRAADGHLADHTMRPEWVMPVVSSAVPAKARGKR